MSHTPGPWRANFAYRIPTIVQVADEDIEIADVHEWLPQFTEERNANARLIAAAPQLLEALEDCVSLLHEFEGEPQNDCGLLTEQIKEAEAACTAGDSQTAKTKADAAISILK